MGALPTGEGGRPPTLPAAAPSPSTASRAGGARRQTPGAALLTKGMISRGTSPQQLRAIHHTA
eukprot:7077741-Lingulodinium_polyedra.AAC.1